MSPVGSNILAGASGQGGDSGYKIERSLRFNSADNSSLGKVFSSGSGSTKSTHSFWIKRCKPGEAHYYASAGESNADSSQIGFGYNSHDVLFFTIYRGGMVALVETTRLFRDPSAWYNIVIIYDSTLATANDRVQIWVNGVRETEFNTNTQPAQNTVGTFGKGTGVDIGMNWNGGSLMNGYLADAHFIDGQALACTDFGEFDSNNVWQPKRYSGSYGTNYLSGATITGNPYSSSYGFHLMFNGTINASSGHSALADTSNTPYKLVLGDSGLTVNSSIKIYYYKDGGTLTINKGEASEQVITSNTGGQFSSTTYTNTQVPVFKNIELINNSGSTQGPYVSGIEIDGTLLVSSGANSFHLDFADNVEPSSYSSNTSGNPYTAGGYSWAQVFNGTTTGSVLTYATTNTTCTLPADVTWSSKIRISALNYPDGYIKINGTTLSNSLFTTSQQWVDLTSVLGSSGTLSTIEVGDVGTNYFRLYAVELDGYILKNSNETSGLGKDTSGNANYFTVNNFSVTAGVGNDSLVDTPTNYGEDTGLGGEVRGNYSTLNPLFKLNTAATIVNGNLQTTAGDVAFSTMLLTSGKWYVECTVTGGAGYNLCLSQPDHPAGNTPSSTNSKSIGWYYTGAVYWGAGYDYSGSVSYTTGDVIAAAIDMDNTTITWYKNGSQVGNVINYSTGSYHRFAEGMLVSQFTGQSQWNFGQRAWANTSVPSGYKAMCTQNLDDPLVADGSTYFDTKLYTGNASTNNITGLGFSPDLVYLKNRSSAGHPVMFDTVRGATIHMQTSQTNSDYTEATGGLRTFNSDGFSLNGYLAGSGNVNISGNSYVAWNWDAGSSNTSIAAGSLNSAVYDTSQTWSNYLTCVSGFYSGHPATYAFDTTYAYPWVACNGVATDAIVYTHPVATTVTSLRFRFYPGQTHTITVAGQSFSVSSTPGSPVWTEVTLPSGGISLNGSSDTITVGGANWNYLDSIEINGMQLVDSGVTLPNVPSIATTVRANPSAGFSIVSYTGTGAAATVAHGLNAAPEFIITKARSNATNWVTGHSGIGWGNFLFLDTTDASGASAAVWNSTAPDSNVFSVASSSYINPSGSGVIAYCFAPVEGYSKFGKYIGNGSADGPFIYTGFRPAWLLIKDTTSAYNWLVFDSERSTYNIVNNVLHPNDLMAENGSGAFNWLDFTSNGFKHRNTGLWHNKSGDTYIYAAFAENPFKTSRAR